MKEINTLDAVGHIISHDITRIIPRGKKTVAFKKGHIVRAEDIPELLKIGKTHLFVWENDGTILHENEAAVYLADLVAKEGFFRGEVSEGKIELFADREGVLSVDTEKLTLLNEFDEIIVATRHDLTPVEPGDKICGTRIIPLVIKKSRMNEVKNRAGEGALFTILPYLEKKTAIITTGSEVFEGLVEDGFTQVLREKLEDYRVEDLGSLMVPDNPEVTANAIKRMLEKGADIVFVTGGMSVDPDDRTPLAIKNTGAEIISYGAPVLPGAMFMLAYLGEKAILGLPGCVMSSKRTILDIVLPRIMAGIRITKKDIIDLAPGGLCLSCGTCIWPACGFGAV
jgi:molybdenum cofactor synthesis domain-containing protein